MKKDDYLQILTNNEIINLELKLESNALMALLENNLRLAGIATQDNELGEEKDKMASFILKKTLELLENKGVEFEEATNILELLMAYIHIEKKLFK